MTSKAESIVSTAASPDLDWSQVKETVLMLKLAAIQVEFSLKDGDSSVNALTDSFTHMAGGLKKIELNAKALQETYRIAEKDGRPIDEQCQQISEKVQMAIIAFQFYDKLVQRLDHVVNSLTDLAELVSDPERLYQPNEWCGLQEKIRSRYTMARERELFDAILAGEDINGVVDRMHGVATGEYDDVELF